MNKWKVIKEVLRPGSHHLNAQLSRMSDREAELINCLHRLDQPATQTVSKATDEAAEF